MNKSKSKSKDIILYCNICNKECKSFFALTYHVNYFHIKKNNELKSVSEYYDKFLKKDPNEGICKISGEKTTFKSLEHGYCIYHGNESKNDAEFIAKFSNSLKKRWENTTKERKKEIRDKAIKTCIDKYGGIGFAINKEITKKKLIEKYGVDNVSKIPEIKKKISESFKKNYEKNGKKIQENKKKNCLKKYGVDAYCKTEEAKKASSERLKNFLHKTEKGKKWLEDLSKRSKEIGCGTEKFKKKLFDKYGVEFPSQIESVSKKIKITKEKTLNEKYGVINVLQIPWVREKCEKTMLLKYGTKNGFSISTKNKEEFEILLENEKFYCDSKLEVKFFEYCKNNKIEVFKAERINYFIENKKHYYTPDFKIKENGKFRLIEIKGSHKYWFKDLENGKTNLKFLAAQIYSEEKGYNGFKLIMDKQINKSKIKEPILLSKEFEIINNALLGINKNNN